MFTWDINFFLKFFVISFTSYDGFEFNLLLLALDKAEKQNEMKPGATIFFYCSNDDNKFFWISMQNFDIFNSDIRNHENKLFDIHKDS